MLKTLRSISLSCSLTAARAAPRRYRNAAYRGRLILAARCAGKDR